VEYCYLGKTGLWVSRLCLGTMNFGVDTDEQEAFKIMDAALDVGLNFFDTANIYGWGDNAGTTEKIIGKWFAQGGNRREKVILATKVHEDIRDANDMYNSKAGLSAYKIRRHLEGSMRRLQADHIELYYMHHIDRNVTWEELWGALVPEVEKGKIDYIGSSNFAGWDIAVAQAAASQRHFIGLVCEQHKYNLNCRIPELEVIPAASHFGLGIIPWAPLDGGLLARNVLIDVNLGRRSKLAEKIKNNYAKLQAFSDFCNDLGEHPDSVALAWLLSNPSVDSPIIGPRTLEQFEQALHALDVKLGKVELTALDNIFPGPGGTTPYAYAW